MDKISNPELLQIYSRHMKKQEKKKTARREVASATSSKNQS